MKKLIFLILVLFTIKLFSDEECPCLCNFAPKYQNKHFIYWHLRTIEDLLDFNLLDEAYAFSYNLLSNTELEFQEEDYKIVIIRYLLLKYNCEDKKIPRTDELLKPYIGTIKWLFLNGNQNAKKYLEEHLDIPLSKQDQKIFSAIEDS